MTMTDTSERARVASFKREAAPPSLIPSGNLAIRSIAMQVLANVFGVSPATIVAKMWPNDLVLRAATSPAMTGVPGWAAELAIRRVADTLEALGPASAGAQLLQQGLVLTMDGAGSISAPGFVAEYGNAGWVAEGQPIPVKQLALTPAIMNPHKLAAIGVLTREMVESSNAEALIGDVLVRAAGRMLDEILFDANPEDAARPAGLRTGIAALTPSNNSDFVQAAFEDMTTLFNAIAPVAGNGPYALIANSGRAMEMRMHTTRDFDNLIILGSSAVINDILAVAPAALVAAMSPDPEVETSRAATLHMEDTAPQPVGSVAPHRSLFQTDSMAVKVHWPVTWALRDPRGFAWLTPSWK